MSYVIKIEKLHQEVCFYVESFSLGLSDGKNRIICTGFHETGCLGDSQKFVDKVEAYYIMKQIEKLGERTHRAVFFSIIENKNNEDKEHDGYEDCKYPLYGLGVHACNTEHEESEKIIDIKNKIYSSRDKVGRVLHDLNQLLDTL